MALQINYLLGGDFQITAYARILSLNLTYDPVTAGLLLANAKFIMKPILEIKSGKLKNRLDTYNSPNWVLAYDQTSIINAVMQAYIYLKTLPEFSGAIDTTD